MTKALLALMLATAFAGIGIRFGSAPAFLAQNQNAIPGAAPAATSGSFTHPLVFPPVDTNGTSQSALMKDVSKSWMVLALTCGRTAAHTRD